MVPVYPDLRGRSALVTGGADGIGRAIAEAFLAQGARVAILDRNAAAIAAFRADAPALIAATVDLTDITATRAAIRQVEEAAGPLTVLVNNAGNDERHAFADVTPEAWDQCLAVNLRHVMFVTQAVTPAMAARGGGSVINLSSTSWIKGAPGLVGYTTAKAAIHGFTRTAAREFGRDHIRVNAIAPGWVMTERQLTRWATPEKLAATLAAQALPRRIEPEDVAALALFLASDASRAMTGQTLILDAGAGDR